MIPISGVHVVPSIMGFGCWGAMVCDAHACICGSCGGGKPELCPKLVGQDCVGCAGTPVVCGAAVEIDIAESGGIEISLQKKISC